MDENNLINHTAKAAHDMRTLLAILQADLVRWQKQFEQSDPSSAMVREASAMYAHTQRLSDLLGTLLLAPVPAKSTDLFDLNKVIGTVVSEYQKAFPQVCFVFQGEEIAMVTGLEKEMTIVLQNIIENALKYGQNHDASPTITCTLRKVAKKYHLTIADQGPGIPRQDLSKVFIPFYRGENATVSGSGLGLSIAREIVLRHHGKISIDSSTVQGTIVSVILPMA